VLAAAVETLLDDHAADRYRLPYPHVSIADNHRRLCRDATAGADGEYQRCRFMNWGSTTDNVLAHLFLADGLARIAFSFWREQHHDPVELGQIFVAELPERELLRLLHRAAWTIVLGGT
jgi:hypothetical protein